MGLNMILSPCQRYHAKQSHIFLRQMNTARSNPIRMLLHLLLSLFSLMDNPCPTDSYLLCVTVKILVITHFALTVIFTHQILASVTNIIGSITPLLWQTDS